ncbi:MAG: ABC transporter substrate-binding protein [Candidatus Kariarchaeaceae archaeon]|jgi:ABC-type transport system substrate-binding protein
MKVYFFLLDLFFIIILVCLPITVSGQPYSVPRPNNFTYVIPGIPHQLDPATNNEPFGKGINEQICERLVNFDGDSTNLIGELATNWSISPDGLNYTFTLRQGVTFTDDTPFNAYTMKYSIDRTHIINDGDGLAKLTLERILSGSDYLKFANLNVSDAHEFLTNRSVSVIDDYTLRIVLNAPFTPFFSMLAMQSMCAVSPNFVITRAPITYRTNISDPDLGMVDLDVWFPELKGNYSKLGLGATHPSLNSGVVPGSSVNSLAEHTGYITDSIGTGPYKLAQNVTTSEIKLVRNTDWWNFLDFHLRAVDEVHIKIIEDGTTRFLELEAGYADSAILDQRGFVNALENTDGIINKPFKVYHPDLYHVLQKYRFKNSAVFFRMDDAMDTIAFVEAADSNYSKGSQNYKSLNKYGSNNPANEPAKPDNPFTSVLFRKAWALSLDYEEVIQQVYSGQGIRMEGVIPYGMDGHDDQLIEEGLLPRFSPIEAESLFKQVGWSGTIDFSYKSSDTLRKTVSQLIKNTIHSYNVSINIIIREDLCAPFGTPCDDFLPLNIVGLEAEYPDPHNFVSYYLHGNENWVTKKNNYTNPLIDSMIDQVKEETDPVQRTELYKSIEGNASEDYTMIYLAQLFTPFITRSWITDVNGSSSLNPFRSFPYIASIGKAIYWDGPELHVDDCGINLPPCPDGSSSSSTSPSSTDANANDVTTTILFIITITLIQSTTRRRKRN